MFMLFEVRQETLEIPSFVSKFGPVVVISSLATAVSLKVNCTRSTKTFPSRHIQSFPTRHILRRGLISTGWLVCRCFTYLRNGLVCPVILWFSKQLKTQSWNHNHWISNVCCSGFENTDLPVSVLAESCCDSETSSATAGNEKVVVMLEEVF
jgi:hypothetical protein